MTDRDRKRAKLEKAAQESAQRTDVLLADELNALKAATQANLQRLKPTITDQETYDKLMTAVQESTAKNESIAQLMNRIQGLGLAAMSLAKQISGMLR